MECVAEEPELRVASDPADGQGGSSRWFSRGVAGIGLASFLSDVGHEVPTSLLPSFLTSTLKAPASALGLIEGISDALAGVARFGGGALADDPARWRRVAVGGYASAAVLSSAIGAAVAPWQAGVFRSAAWSSRGLRVPARNALLADVVPAQVCGRALFCRSSLFITGTISTSAFTAWSHGPPSRLPACWSVHVNRVGDTHVERRRHGVMDDVGALG
jgi:hypothetical protein